MYGHVTDDGSRQRRLLFWQHLTTRRSPGVKFTRRFFVFLTVLTFCLLLGGNTVFAQDSTLRATVHQLDKNREWIHIPVNKSVLIETNLPAVRQQTLSPEIAQIQPVSPTQILVTGKSFGRTQVLIWSADRQQQIFDVSVELELDLLNQAIEQLDPLAQVNAVPIMETVVLTGTASDAEAADRIMQIAQIFAPNVQNHLQVAGQQQVMLRCTVAEVQKTAMKQLGVNGYLWGNDFKDFPFVSNVGQINPATFGRPAAPVNVDVGFAAPATQLGLNPTISFGLPRVQTQLFIQALKENGLVKILAEPNLVTISGRTASFLAGGEFPVPIPQASTGTSQTITIEFREFGVRLTFTPIVLANQRIRLHVAPEVSELDFAQGVSFSGFVIPGLNSRRAETTVEIGNGQTMLIAGLLNEKFRTNVSKVPGLGEVPVLGALFRSTQFSKSITDLVIIVSPEIVAPVNPGQLKGLPGHDMTEPDDYQLFALGLLEGDPKKSENDEIESEELESNVEEVDSVVQASILGPWGQSDQEEVD